MNKQTGLLSTSHSGAIAEAIGAGWLLDQGYVVFQNVTNTGPADLVAWKPGNDPFVIDVKSICRFELKDGSIKTKSGKLTSEQEGWSVRVLYVCRQTNVISWDKADCLKAYADRNNP